MRKLLLGILSLFLIFGSIRSVNGRGHKSGDGESRDVALWV